MDFHDDNLVWVKDLKYDLNCNWKVLQDNNIDGGYHIPYVHKGLAGNIDLDTYKTEVTEAYSMQSAKAKGHARVGEEILYTVLYPGTVVNSYGPWVELNLVYPTGAKSCQVAFEYYLQKSFVESRSKESLKKFIDESLKSSNSIQEEDVRICNAVQKGLEASAFHVGRYAPTVEMANHAFHIKLAQQYEDYLNKSA